MNKQFTRAFQNTVSYALIYETRRWVNINAKMNTSESILACILGKRISRRHIVLADSVENERRLCDRFMVAWHK